MSDRGPRPPTLGVALLCSLLLAGCPGNIAGGTQNGDGDARVDDGGAGGDFGPGDTQNGDLGPGDPGTGDAGPGDSGGGDAGNVLTCTSCHGNAANVAPPIGSGGTTETSAVGVGAHQSHLGASTWHREILCTDCHIVPQAIDDPGHIDTALPAELTWSALASADGVSPVFNGVSCDVYCHGASLISGGSNTQPSWTVVDGTQAACGTCHGTPPTSWHPPSTQCELCHPTIDATGAFLDPSRHIDGIVDSTALPCDTCHGSNGNPAPPVDLEGDVETTFPGVGAHRSHQGASTWHREVQCSDCHIVPVTVSDAGHSDTAPPAELTWGSIADEDGTLSPTFDDASERCSNTYCHGSSLFPGGSNLTPQWTSVGTGEAACGSCHGLPPAGPTHTPWDYCTACHPTVDADRNFINPASHIDGVKDFNLNLACDACHGSGGNAAPPNDLDGNTDTFLVTVGAHRSHLGPSTWHREIACTECHVVPTQLDDPGHYDTLQPAEVTWGPLAANDGAVPSWDSAAETCSNVYCHGVTLPSGGQDLQPQWTSVGTGQASCGVSCHSTPPGAPHSTATACDLCHPDVVDASMNIIGPDLHINGVPDFVSAHATGWNDPASHGSGFNDQGPAACTSCHGADLTGGTSGVSCDACHSSPNWKTDCTFCHGGTDNNTGAPPQGVDGEISVTALPVGAHTSHVADTGIHSGRTCSVCHGSMPTDVLTPGHIDGDGRAEVIFDALNPTAGYDYGTGGCSSLYCHGNGQADDGSMVWNTTPAIGCGSCHDVAGPASTGLSGAHQTHTDTDGRALACQVCHGLTAVGSNAIADITQHVDGGVDLYLAGAPRQSDGTGSLGTTCNNLYCHSAGNDFTAPFADAKTITWGSTTTCSSCHGTAATMGAPSYPDDAPKNNSHTAHAGETCNRCHAAVVDAAQTITGSALHVNGAYDLQAAAGEFTIGSAGTDTTPTTCNNIVCHGGNTATWGAQLGCNDCHLGAADVDNWNVNDGTLSVVSSNEWSAVGHGQPAVGFPGSACLYCHDAGVAHGDAGNPFRLANFDATGDGWASTCLVCHATLAPGYDPGSGLEIAVARIDATHVGSKHGTGNDGGTRCWDCHDPHGDDANIKMVGDFLLRDATDAFGLTGTRTGTPVVFLADATGSDFARTSGPFNGVCNVCHTSTLHYTATSGDGHNSGNACVNCHDHNQPPTDAFRPGAGPCNSCHNAPPTTPAVGNIHAAHDESGAVPTAYGQTANASTPTQYRFPCGKCHPAASNQHMNGPGTGTAASPFQVQVDGQLDDTSDPRAGATASYTAGGTASSEQGPGALYFRYTDGQCSNVYCHGEFAGGDTANDPTMAAGTQPCGACHGASTSSPPSAGSHATHVGSLTLSCNGCHESTTNGAGAVIDKSVHVNGAADWNLLRTDARWGATASYSAAESGGKNPPSAVFGSCQDVYCHSNGAPVTGGSLSWTPTWGGPAMPADCTGCHGNDETSASLIGNAAGSRAGSLTHSRHVDGATYSFQCDDCHSATMSTRADNRTLAAGSNHVNATKNVDFSTWPVTQTAGAWNSGTHACSNTYCHSQGKVTGGTYTGAGDAPLVAADWDNPVAGCATCHDDASTTTTALSGAHMTHTETDAYSVPCQRCHGQTVTGSTAIASYALHVNGVKDTSLSGAPHGADGTGTLGGTCNNLYCHSAGADFTGPTFYGSTTPSWGGSITTCWGCHGSAATNGAPSYANGATLDGTAKANRHASHTAYECAACHANVVSAGASPSITGYGQHVDGTYDLQAGSGVAFSAAAGSPGTPTTCDNISCHGGGSATWGATLGCADCHGGPTDVDNWNIADGTPSVISSSEWSSVGHGEASVGLPGSSPCLYCHDSSVAHGDATNPFRLANYNVTGDGWRSACLVCHESTATGYDPGSGLVNPTTKISAYHAGTKHGAGNDGGTRCWDCHDPHGDDANIKMIGDIMLRDSADAYGLTGTRTSTPVVFTANSTGTDYAKSSGTFNGVCNVCHTSTSHYTASSGDSHNSGLACTGCHPHDQPPASAFAPSGESGGGIRCSSCHTAIWDGMNGAASKTSRHSLGATVGTNDASTDSGITWGSPLTANAPAVRSCVNMCHDDHVHNLASPATVTHDNNVYVDSTTSGGRAATSRTSADKSRTDFDGAQTNGGLCVSCHRFPVSAGRPTISAAGYDASAHDFVSNGSGTWTYDLHDGSQFDRNCTKCHADRADGRPSDNSTPFGSVHFSSFGTLLAGEKNAGNAATLSEFVCYNCHGNGTTGTDFSGKDIATQAAKTYGHPVDSDAVHDSQAEYTSAAFGNQLGGAARHAACADCHDPHRAQAGTHATPGNLAGPPLDGAWGAELSSNPAFWVAPAAGNFTKKVITAGVDLEATLCFKCHSSYYGTLPASPSGGFQETDTARELNPNNIGNYAGTWSSGETAGSFHPVLAAADGNLGATDNIKAPFTVTSTMTCSDCHESDTTTDPNGPHGSAAAFLLKGPNTLWNATLVTGSGGMPNGTFCINCHEQALNSTVGTRFTRHTRSDHRIACFNCHAAIPHGTARPGLLVTPTSTSTGGLMVTDSGPYLQLPAGGYNSGMRINSYPNSSSNSWSRSNCSCWEGSWGH